MCSTLEITLAEVELKAKNYVSCAYLEEISFANAVNSFFSQMSKAKTDSFKGAYVDRCEPMGHDLLMKIKANYCPSTIGLAYEYYSEDERWKDLLESDSKLTHDQATVLALIFMGMNDNPEDMEAFLNGMYHKEDSHMYITKATSYPNDNIPYEGDYYTLDKERLGMIIIASEEILDQKFRWLEANQGSEDYETELNDFKDKQNDIFTQKAILESLTKIGHMTMSPSDESLITVEKYDIGAGSTNTETTQISYSQEYSGLLDPITGYKEVSDYDVKIYESRIGDKNQETRIDLLEENYEQEYGDITVDNVTKKFLHEKASEYIQEKGASIFMKSVIKDVPIVGNIIDGAKTAASIYNEYDAYITDISNAGEEITNEKLKALTTRFGLSNVYVDYSDMQINDTCFIDQSVETGEFFDKFMDEVKDYNNEKLELKNSSELINTDNLDINFILTETNNAYEISALVINN